MMTIISSIKKTIKLVLYIMIMVVVVIISVEFILRVMGFTYSTPHIIYDKYCYWRMAPNQKMHFKDVYGKSANITINSLGARGGEIKLKKSEGEKRMICVGGSYTYGWGTDDSETYLEYLENLFRSNSSNMDVINFGCNGHTILQEVDLIKKYGLRLKPDYVMVEASLCSDFKEIDELEYQLGYMPMPGYNFVKYFIRKTAIGNILLGYWDSKKVKDIIAHRKQLKGESAGENVLQDRTRTIDSQPRKTTIITKNGKTPFEIYIDKLDELLGLAQENNFRIIYLLTPYYIRGLDDYKIEGEYVNGAAMTAREFHDFLKKRYGDKIYFVELISYFSSKNLGSEDLFLPDKHLNAKGNKLAAEIIYEKIKNIVTK